MTSSPRARATGFTAAIAIVAALLSPLVALSAADAASIDGATGGVAPNAWQDRTISDVFIVGVPYQDSLQAPAGYATYDSFAAYNIPAGLQAYIVPSTGVISITGTPTTAGTGLSINIAFQGANISPFYINFTGLTVTAPLTPTTTTVSADPVQNFAAFTATAQVSPSTATGSVTFKLGNIIVGSAPVVAGEATYSGAASSANIGTNSVLTAIYSGDASYASSTSTSTATVATYGIRVLTGTVSSNGEPVVGETVVLQEPTGAATGFSDTTDATGTFEIYLGIPTTAAAVTAQYRLYASGFGVYYKNGATESGPRVTALADASPLINSNWNAPLNVFASVAPTWTDQTLAQPRVGDSYSDSVAATSTGTPSTVTYSLTGDPLPSWLTFANGAFSSTGPTDQLAHTFTVVATSNYGSISKQFTLQAAAAGVAPTFTDTTIAEPQQGSLLTDGIAASGDPTITYSSTTLPAGLSLNASTGALTGTPTTAGDYSVTFTAINEFGSDTFDWEPTIVEPSSVSLVLDNWIAGTPLEDTDFEARSESLQVGSAYTVYLHSTPVLLDSGVVPASGSFSDSLTLPSNTEVGAHELILTGVARNGPTITAHVWFTLLPNGTIGSVSYTGPVTYLAAVQAALAATGSEPLLPIGIAGALMLAGFLVMRRRSQQA